MRACSGASAPTTITDVIDFASLHTYVELDTYFDPTRWEWKLKSVPAAQRATAMMDAALVESKRQYQAARAHLDGRGLVNIPITIGETGWKAVASSGETYRAHPVTQKIYFDLLNTWKTSGAGPKNIVWFEAFDEPWKGGDDKWGLFNVSRKARFWRLSSKWV